MNNYPEIIHYLGRYHVLLLHLPIGFIVIAFLMELNSRSKKTQTFESAITFILFWSAILSLVTSVSGYMLSLEGGYESTLLDRHYYLGWGTTLLCFVVYYLKKKKTATPFSFISFAGLIGLLLWTGHIGGSLTHGVDHLSAYSPVFATFDRSKDIADKWVDSTQVFTGIVQPILKEKCIQCHNGKKKKGGLLLTSIEHIQKGGDNGQFLIAGDLNESQFLQKVHLPITEKEHMPPNGKTQLTDDEIRLLEWWVEQGASFTDPLASFEKPKAIQAIIDRNNTRPEGVFALNIPAPNTTKLKKLQEEGLRIRRIAAGNHLLELDLSGNTDIKNETLRQLRKFSKQIIHLDLANTNVSDKVSRNIANLPHLTTLHLQGTPITDKTLKRIRKLKYLEYLNLYDTNVTDKGLAFLKELKSLKKLYLWQTKTTKEGLQELSASLTNLNITSRAGDEVFTEVRLNTPDLKIIGGANLFKDSVCFKLKNSFKSASIYYTLDGSLPDKNALLYEDSVTLNKSVKLQVVAVKEGWTNSEIVEKDFVRVSWLAQKVSLSKAPSSDYPGEGPQTLSDLKRGGGFVKSPTWMGWQGTHLTAVLDYGESVEFSNIKVGYMENTNAWVFAPAGLKVWTSTAGKQYTQVINESYPPATEPSAVNRLFLSHDFIPTTARYVKVKVESTMKNPDWHLSPGEPSWLFLDEVVVQ